MFQIENISHKGHEGIQSFIFVFFVSLWETHRLPVVSVYLLKLSSIACQPVR